ncbi:hypothetical protein LAG90_18800 [Marinilongibacter aquaticus]|uniref:hypothetical protein n=1 Tax=Marinilongibacter aquaticus TaxID=2975157 RepID=UPI0021BDE7A4|nr:hypothetical protein [Marinilongibacter aquaticus]UBM58849.1 hypothetical protein LAG90_18800 [Marinilongibacter aquaticus]
MNNRIQELKEQIETGLGELPALQNPAKSVLKAQKEAAKKLAKAIYKKEVKEEKKNKAKLKSLKDKAKKQKAEVWQEA